MKEIQVLLPDLESETFMHLVLQFFHVRNLKISVLRNFFYMYV